jgi:phosphoribosylanthranilate isomerase
MIKIKICGITRLIDALAAVEYGADAIGFIFSKSPRRIGLFDAKKICSALPPFVFKVGVFVDTKQEKVLKTIRYCGLDAVQLHGNETDKYCAFLRKYCKIIKAIRVINKKSIDDARVYKNIDALLFDSYVANMPGGTGKQFAHKLLKNRIFKVPVIISGGINPANAAMVVKLLKPYGIDVSSGVETKPGIKSHKAIKDLINRVGKY